LKFNFLKNLNTSQKGKRPAAIVSSIPGTTRDVIESSINIGDYPIVLSDTAGLRESKDLIEIEGVKRALERIENADLVVLIVDVSQNLESIVKLGLGEFLERHISRHLNMNEKISSIFRTKQIILTFNKIDLLTSQELKVLNEKQLQFSRSQQPNSKISVSMVSCIDSENNINDLLDRLKEKLSEL
jgi:tRNA modification GTPase